MRADNSETLIRTCRQIERVVMDLEQKRKHGHPRTYQINHHLNEHFDRRKKIGYIINYINLYYNKLPINKERFKNEIKREFFS